MIGKQISRYKITSDLGQGGMGIVYAGEDTRLGRKVAIKLLPPLTSRDPKARSRFENEARAASALDHPNICTIHEIGEDDEGHLFLVMSFYQGHTLEERLEDGPLTAEETIRIASEVARGLDAAHKAGIVHRDIKPGNVMLTDDGRVIILDFGLAKVEDVNITQEGDSVGTVTYMSPEQARGQTVDHRTDIWSLGVMLYEMFSGQKPFKAQYSQAVLYGILNEQPPALSDVAPHVPTEWAKVVDACLEKEPERRPASIGELFERVAADAPAETPTDHAGRHRMTALSLGLVLVLVVAALVGMPSLRSAVWDSIGVSSLPSEKHVAVLLAQDDSGPEGTRVLAAGLQASLVETLQRAEAGQQGFWVVPNSRTVRAALASPLDARAALGVNIVLTLELQSAESGLALKLDMVDAESGRVRDSRLILHPRSSMDVMRSEMTIAAAEMLQLPESTGITPFVNKTESVRPGAADFYTQGLGYLSRHTEGDNLAASVVLFKRAIMADSSFALAYAGLCASYWRKWELEKNQMLVAEAEYHCERALELESDLTGAYVTLGRLHAGMGRYGTALGEFQLALARDSTNVDALIGMATVYDDLDRLEEAEQTYKRAIALKPDNWFGYSNLGVFYFNQARYEDALDQFLFGAELNPLNFRMYSNAGAMYFYLDRREEAIDMFRLALEIKDDLGAWSNLATLLYYEGRYAESAEAFEAALELSDDGSYVTWGYLGTAYRWSGQEEKADQADRMALNLARQALDINPRDQELMGHLANYYAALGIADSAHVMINQLAGLNPSDPQELSRIAEAYEKLGDRAAAIEWTTRALESGYALAEIVDYPGFADLIADPNFAPILLQYQSSDVLEQEIN